MSTIHFVCPNCSKSMDVPSELEGQQGVCPSCKQPSLVTATTPSPQQQAPQQQPLQQQPLQQQPLQQQPLQQQQPQQPYPQQQPQQPYPQQQPQQPYPQQQPQQPYPQQQPQQPYPQQQPQQPYPQQPTNNIDIETALQNMNTKNKDYYRQQFQTINNSTGFQASFNICAFFFSAFWYLHHKMWGKALVLFAVSLVTGGFAAPLIWIYGGIAGNYDLHLKYVQRKDWW